MTRRWVRGGAIAAVTGLWLAAAAGVGAAGHEVEMRDFAFKPKTVTIATGDRVTWVNTGNAPHDAVGDGWSTTILDNGGSDSVRFTRAGSYAYLCSVHPGLMTGTVVVRDPSGGGGNGGGGNGGGGNGGGQPTTPPTDTAAGSASGPADGPGPAGVALLGLAALGGLVLGGRRRSPVRAR